MTIISEDPIAEAAKSSAAAYKNASPEEKAALVRAIADELGVGLEGKPLPQAALLDAIHANMGGESLLRRATFARGVIAVLDIDARMIVNGERRQRGHVLA
jgi:hypothetical protein